MRTSLSRLATDLETLEINKNEPIYKFKDVLKKMVQSMRAALKQLRSIEYDKHSKIETDIWDQLVARPQNVTYTSGDSLHFMIKWCELFRHQISYISSYELALIMSQEKSLKNGEFEKLSPYQYSNFVNKFNSKTIIFPYNKGKNHWVIYIVINHHNSKLIHTHIEEKIEKDISEEQSNEEFPCIICFDSLSFNNPKRISSTVIVPGNKLVVGDKVSVFLWMFLNHIRQTNVFNNYTLPLFYAKCQSQIGMSCGYHAMMIMFTLAKFWGEYIPVKFKETGITMKSLKSYVDNKDE